MPRIIASTINQHSGQGAPDYGEGPLADAQKEPNFRVVCVPDLSGLADMAAKLARALFDAAE